MKAEDATVNINQAFKKCTLKVKVVGVKTFKLRVKVAMFFFWVGSKICGMGIEFTSNSELVKSPQK